MIRLRPSSAHRWVHCARSASLEATLPEDEEGLDGEAAAEGTAVHWYIAEVLSGREPGDTAPNGVIVTREMRERGKLMIDLVRTVTA